MFLGFNGLGQHRGQELNSKTHNRNMHKYIHTNMHICRVMLPLGEDDSDPRGVTKLGVHTVI